MSSVFREVDIVGPARIKIKSIESKNRSLASTWSRALINKHKSLPMKSSLINVEPSSFRIAAYAAAVVVQHVLHLRIQKREGYGSNEGGIVEFDSDGPSWKFLTSLVIPTSGGHTG